MLLLLTPTILAAPPEFATVGDPVALLSSGSGTWPRLFPREDGSWTFIMANGGDLYWRTLYADLSTKDETRRNMTNHAGLTDHALAACPDGGLIDAASSYTSDWDDTLTIFRWDADFNLVNKYVLDDNNTTHTYADAAIICEEDLTIVGGFIERDKPLATTPAYVLDHETGDLVEEIDLLTSINWFGAAWAWDGENAVNLRASTNGSEVFIDKVDTETWTTLKGEGTVVTLDLNADTHWFVRTLAWGDHWIVPFIHLSFDYNWSQGTGDLFLAVFNSDWELVSTTRITDYQGGSGANQPWVTTDGEVIAVSWTKEVQPYGAIITLKDGSDPGGGDTGKGSGGSDTADTTPADSGGGGETDDTGEQTEPNPPIDTGTEDDDGCGGCSTARGGLSGLFGALLLGALLRRRGQYTAG